MLTPRVQSSPSPPSTFLPSFVPSAPAPKLFCIAIALDNTLYVDCCLGVCCDFARTMSLETAALIVNTLVVAIRCTAVFNIHRSLRLSVTQFNIRWWQFYASPSRRLCCSSEMHNLENPTVVKIVCVQNAEML